MTQFLCDHLDKILAAVVGLSLFMVGRYFPKLKSLFGKIAAIRVNPVHGLFTLASLCGLTFVGTQAVSHHKANLKESQFDAYVVAAYNATDAQTAKKQFDRALTWVSNNQATHGFTSVNYESPVDNVADWYDHLRLISEDFAKADATTTPTEAKPWQVSMKRHRLIQETVVGKDNKVLTVKVNAPDRLHLHPVSKEFFWTGLVSSVSGLAFLALGIFASERRKRKESTTIV